LDIAAENFGEWETVKTTTITRNKKQNTTEFILVLIFILSVYNSKIESTELGKEFFSFIFGLLCG